MATDSPPVVRLGFRYPTCSIPFFPMSIRPITLIRTGLFALALGLCSTVAVGQMPQQGDTEMLSSSDVTDEQVQKVARIAVAAQMSTQEERMQMRKDMKEKYGNPQEMDSTEKANARREMRKKQMAMRKKQKKVMQKEAQEEGMDPAMVQKILRSSQQDKKLQKRLRKAMKAQMKKQKSQMGGGQGGGQSGGQDDMGGGGQ